MVSVAECLRPGGTKSEIISDFGQVLVRYGKREWKDLFKQAVGSAEKRRSFPDVGTTTLSKISHGSSRDDHLRHSTSTSHFAKASFGGRTDLTIIVMPVWHASRFNCLCLDVWHRPTLPKPSSASNVANTGDVKNLLLVVLTSLPALRRPGTNHGSTAWHGAFRRCKSYCREVQCP